MTAVIADITQQAVFNAVAGFIASIVDCPVLRAQVNRVAMPTGDFVMMTPVRQTPLAVSVNTYSETNLNVQRSTQFDIQIDCYGAQSGDRAQTIATLLRDGYSFDSMAAGIKPLYASDAQQMPLITGEEQYLERWTLEASVQANPTLSLPQDFMDSAVVGLIEVDAKYPPT